MSAEARTSGGTTSELLADRAYAALRDRIVTLRIAPGEPIDEDALGRELDIGRTPVREAIKRLALENLVTVFPRRGTFASEINITDLAHISDVRAAARGPRRVPRRAAPHRRARAELEALLAGIAAADGATRRELMALDAHVHRFVHRCAGEPVPRGDARRATSTSRCESGTWSSTGSRTFPRAYTSTARCSGDRGGDADKRAPS